MVRPVRWVLVATGLAVLAGGGASIFWTPPDEVLYAVSGPSGPCTDRVGCIGVYDLEVGNTGREPQEDIRVRLHAAVVDSALLPPRVRDYGKIDRPVRVTREGEAVTFALGRLEPEQRVTVSFVLRRESREALPAWADALVAVEAARGPAAPGNPAGVILLRLWYMLVRAL